MPRDQDPVEVPFLGAIGELALFPSSDELIGNVIEVIAYDLRLRADSKDIVANTLYQRCIPTRSDRAEGIPCVAGDETELGGFNAKLLFDKGASLARRLIGALRRRR